MTNPTKQKPVCPYCGSDQVSMEAIIYWDIDSQEWESYSSYDKSGYCSSCEYHDISSFDWVDIDESSNQTT